MPPCPKLLRIDIAHFDEEGMESFGLTGIYSSWREDDNADPIYSFVIITCEPNELVLYIHDRMPVILTQESERIWTNPVRDVVQL